MSNTVRGIVESVVRLLRPVDPRALQSALGVQLVVIDDNPTSTVERYAGHFPSGPFDKIDFRTNRETLLAFLVVYPRADLPLSESSLNLRQYGQTTIIDINPQIPPEGTQSFAQTIQGVRILWQFTMRSRVLRLVSVEWPARAP